MMPKKLQEDLGAERLRVALRAAMGNTRHSLSERLALETAIEIADEWRHRLSELGDEDDSETAPE